MEVRRYELFDEFRAAAEPIYGREPVSSTIELTVLYGNVRPIDPLLLIVSKEGVPVGAAMQTPPYPLLCSALPEPAIANVAAEVARIRPQLPGVLGLRPAATQFANAWQTATGTKARWAWRNVSTAWGR